jgi:hypothetical protein
MTLPQLAQFTSYTTGSLDVRLSTSSTLEIPTTRSS